MKPENLEYWKQLVLVMMGCDGETPKSACRNADEVVEALETRVADMTDPLVTCGNYNGAGFYFHPDHLDPYRCPICGGRGAHRESELPKRD